MPGLVTGDKGAVTPAEMRRGGVPDSVTVVPSRRESEFKLPAVLAPKFGLIGPSIELSALTGATMFGGTELCRL